MPGYHLPFLAAAADGLFAQHGFDAEILEPAPGPDNVERVAQGGADFCLTSTTHYMTAWARSGPQAARFVSIVTQRHPMAGLVDAAKDLRTPVDLAGRRVGSPADSSLLAEYQLSLQSLDLAPGNVVPVDYAEAPAALGRGEVDVVPDFADLVPRTRSQAGVDVRAVPFNLAVYGSGLVAADRIDDELVARVRAAVVEALERQRIGRDTGLTELSFRYPGAPWEWALEGWKLLEPRVFVDGGPTAMTGHRWSATVDFLTRAHQLPAIDAGCVYRASFTTDGASAAPPSTSSTTAAIEGEPE